MKHLCGLLELFEKRKVALISVAEPLDTGSAAGRLVITIMGAVSQWEREGIGERTCDALRHKRSDGERVGNIEFGYRLSADLQHLEPDPTEQTALAEIRNLRRKGHTLRGIAITPKQLRAPHASRHRMATGIGRQSGEAECHTTARENRLKAVAVRPLGRRAPLIRRQGSGVWLHGLLHRRLCLKKGEYCRHVVVGESCVRDVVHQRETVRAHLG